MEINIWQVLFQVINFGVILFVLNKILYKPVLKLLDDRAKKINEGQAMAEKNLKEAAELDKVRKTELAKVRKEASAIISKAEEEAAGKAHALLAESRQKAKEEAAKIVASGTKELENSRKSLDKEAAQLGLAMVTKALEKTLSAKEVDGITSGLLKAMK
ncbi:MAG: ATP synthase subunit b [Microgenomates group bacterium GW2011_GWC1_46_16]|uniref:ATP synthase subunit b n=2 Tax=Candidatus Collieribacteriota TaxID=1752725 RepID=A0A1F5FYU7_9BACT|nr:MAG: ATP synthase subunit b [Microgenomates group bacterium GW2011_GWF1_46_12]KKU25993.1 MAG: ATP synthase subunit b [Microgenomates group bacterium GW2011_GWC1_46_16]KKU28196.1 MAG: ATP synthase subunit b [Microgenomates group bacterium GW2011_GWF2_46_18]KKU43890.1 MAG: ATP synthase subunit b [Microgenomates group bacterium GW2011_GWA1_46_7]KKU45587.1 MAG: ATP synthase subunit b [Microgenomates group bacterium GW2011_GWB1_46_7]KKU61570.1 MAG: ATP synthase subunit b [Microgenomates group ba